MQYRTTPRNGLPYTDPVIARDADTTARLARIERLIEQYREQKNRQLLLRAIKLWRRAEADQRLAILDLPSERVH